MNWPLDDEWKFTIVLTHKNTSDSRDNIGHMGMHQVITKIWNEFSSLNEDITNQSKESIPHSDSDQTFHLRLHNFDNARVNIVIILLKIMRNKIRDASSFLLL